MSKSVEVEKPESQVGYPKDIHFYCSFLIAKTLYAENHELKKKLEKTLKKIGKSHTLYARELNTFMVAHGRIKPEITSEVDHQELLESELRTIHEDYVHKIINKIRNDIWYDTEVSESRKALEKAQKFHGTSQKSMVKEQLSGIQRVLYESIREVVSQTSLFLWEDSNTGACRLVTHSAMFSDVFKDLSPGEFGGLTDESTLLVFGKTFIRLLEPLLVNLLEITNSFKLMINNIIKDLSGDVRSNKHREVVAEVIRVLLGKILGIRETLRSSSRQVWRFSTLVKEMSQTESEVEKRLLDYLTSEFLDQEAVSERDQQIGQLNSMISDIIPHLRDLVEKAENREISTSADIDKEHMHLTAIGDFYAELEKLRFWTDLFEDIPYFTLMPGGIAFETEEFAKKGFFKSLVKGLTGLIPFVGREKLVEDTSISEDIVLQAEDLFKTYRLANSTVYAIRGVSFSVKRGEFVAITGPSGSGKTTLLNIISGLDIPDRGAVYLDRFNISQMSDDKLTELRRDRMGFIFQYYNLLPVLTANENVALPAQLGGNNPGGKALKNRVNELMVGVQLQEFGHQVPLKLSGGQMQRVTIARSMVNNPDILFADEPTGDLDSVTGQEIMKLISTFHSQGSSVVLITHDPEIAQMADRIIELQDGQVVREVKPL